VKSLGITNIAEDNMSLLVTLFDKVNIAAHGNAIGPAGGLDLSGYSDYRLVLRLDGQADTGFTINELYGPAGEIDQLNIDIATRKVGSLGSLNYRGRFTVYGPTAFFIRVFNNGEAPLRVSGSLYAVI
jgi:hypothetical protein